MATRVCAGSLTGALRPRAALVVVAVWFAAFAAIAGVAGVAGCGRNVKPVTAATEPSAREGLTEFAKMLRGDNAKPAYAMLTADAKAEISFAEFSRQWNETKAERKLQADAIMERLKNANSTGEQAKIQLPDGRSIYLSREKDHWRLEAALLGQSRAARPREAVAMFADALKRKDYAAVLNLLTERRRNGISSQIDAFIESLEKNATAEINQLGNDRAELRWDEAGFRYRLVLRKEHDEWRIDDIHVQRAPKDGDDDDDSGDDDDSDDDFPDW